jgi:hypothetical protein
MKPDECPEEFSRDRLFGWLFRHLEVPRWGQFFFWVFFMSIVVLASSGWYGFLHLSERAKDTDCKIEQARNDLGGKIEQSESRLNTRIDSVITQLAQELIKRAKSDTVSNKLAEAGKEIAEASRLISLSRRNNLRAPPEFFVEAILSLDGIASIPEAPPTLLSNLRQIRFQLAEYRSAITPIPEGLSVITAKPMEHAFIIWSGSGMYGGVLDMRSVTGSAIVPRMGNFSPTPYVRGTVIFGGTQILDAVEWTNVTFIGTHIQYHGGQVELINTTFVNCVFDLSQNKRGEQIAEYAALLSSRLDIG